MSHAARLGDPHVCPVGGPPPHVGGPVSGPGCPSVLIDGRPAARAGDSAVCNGPSDTIAAGSPTVIVGGAAAARVGDPTVHGGRIVAGTAAVRIGVTAATGALLVAAQHGAPFCALGDGLDGAGG